MYSMVVLSRLSGVWDLSLWLYFQLLVGTFFPIPNKMLHLPIKKDLLGWVGELVVCMVWTVE